MPDADTIMPSAAQLESSQAVDNQKASRGDRGRRPRAQSTNARTQSYDTQRLSCTAPESSPSTGWREVYAEMGVDWDGQR